MPSIVAKTNIVPDYSKFLYYTKDGSVYCYDKKSKKKKVVAANVFSRKPGMGYVLKRSASGKLMVVGNSLAALRAKRKGKRRSKKRKSTKKK